MVEVPRWNVFNIEYFYRYCLEDKELLPNVPDKTAKI